MNSPQASNASSRKPTAFPKLVIIQICVFVVTVGALIAVVLQIDPLIEKKAELTAEIAKHSAQIQELGDREKLLQLRIEQLTNWLQEQETTSRIQSIEGRASQRSAGGTTASGRALYDFTLWVDVPAEIEPEISRVKYKLDHPNFSRKTLLSSDRANGFEVKFRGWGCLGVVKVTIFFTDGTAQPIYFKMCQALVPSDRDPHG